jgi:hypothetical protein
VLADRLLDFEALDSAWSNGATALARGGIGRRREDALAEIAGLQQNIIQGRAESLADAAVQLYKDPPERDQTCFSPCRGHIFGTVKSRYCPI